MFRSGGNVNADYLMLSFKLVCSDRAALSGLASRYNCQRIRRNYASAALLIATSCPNYGGWTLSAALIGCDRNKMAADSGDVTAGYIFHFSVILQSTKYQNLP